MIFPLLTSILEIFRIIKKQKNYFFNFLNVFVSFILLNLLIFYKLKVKIPTIKPIFTMKKITLFSAISLLFTALYSCTPQDLEQTTQGTTKAPETLYTDNADEKIKADETTPTTSVYIGNNLSVKFITNGGGGEALVPPKK